MLKLNKKGILIIISIILIAVSCLLPLPEGLSRQGMQSLGIILAALVLWIGEVMNMAVTGIMMAVLLVFLGVLSPTAMFQGFGGSVFFFMVGTMSITTAMSATSIPTRMAGLIMKWAKKSPTKLIVGFAIGTALLSSIMSNIPTCALFASLGMAVIKANGNPKPGSSGLGKCLMIAIPAGSVIGGFMTPAGGPSNIIAMNYLTEIGHPITFVQWMLQGYPFGLLITVVVALWITFVHKPEKISDAALAEADKMISGHGKLSVKEIKTLLIIAVMFVCWIASSWVPILNTTCVALLGTCLFMFPGLDVLTWDDYSKNGGWDASFMVGAVGALADAVLKTGAATWLINNTMAGAKDLPAILIFLEISLLVCVLHILCPSGPAVAGLAVVPLVELSLMVGINPISTALLVSFWSATTFVLPTDAVPMFTYKYGYYSFKDMAKSGIPVSLLVVILAGVGIPLAMKLMQIM